MPASAAVEFPPGFTGTMTATGFLAGRHECDGHPLMHRHPEIEINYIASGSIEYQLGADSLVVGKGSMIVFWASRPHVASHLVGGTTQYWFHVPVSTFRSWELPINPAVLGGSVAAFVVDDDYGRGILHQIVDDTEQSRSSPDRSEQLQTVALLSMRSYMERLSILQEDPVLTFDPSRTTGRPAEMASFIALTAGNPDLSVADVARAVGLHPTTAMREFKHGYGITIWAYLVQHRVSWAQQLLLTTDANVAQVGYSVGFRSSSSFYSSFCSIVGMPPGQFRRASVLQ